MKKLLTLIALFAFMTGYSQDEITKQDGSVIKVKVTDILDGVIKYKKFENLDGPTYSLETSKIKQVKYANGSIDTFESTTPAAPAKAVSSETEKPAMQGSPKKLLDDPNFKRQVEAIAKDVGEQVIESCSGVKDNSGTDIYWDGVYKDMESGDITVPIRAWWNKKWSTEGNKKWIRGKVIVRKSGEKQWVYQSAGGLNFTGCAEKLRLK